MRSSSGPWPPSFVALITAAREGEAVPSTMCRNLLRWFNRFIKKISGPDPEHLGDPDKS